MPKRKADQLTGGSGDVKPQYIVASMDVPAGTAAQASVKASFVIPIPPGTSGGNGKTILVPELLSISRMAANMEALLNEVDGASGKWAVVRVSTGGPDIPSASALLSTPSQRTFYQFYVESGGASFNGANNVTRSGAGTGGTDSINFTDSAGNGIIMFGNTFTISAVSEGTGWPQATVRWIFWIKYRLSEVTLEDYLAGSAAIGGLISGSVQTGT